MELWLTVNGKRVSAGSQLDPLTRAVVISLFTHRRADPDDNADVPMGWWGDTWPVVANDRYGSKLWLCCLGKRSARRNTCVDLPALDGDGHGWRYDCQ